MDLEEFKTYCIEVKSDIIVQQFLIDGTTFYFEKIKKGEEFIFKKDIANILNIHIRDIVIVGSGKLGFSIKPDYSEEGLRLFKKFDHNHFNNESTKKSDLDIAIVSSFLFDKEIRNLYDHTDYYKNIWNERNDFAKFILKGRLVVRFLPTDFPLTKEIQIVQGKYQKEYGREINIEIYKSWYYFETYHQENIKNIQVNLLR